MKELPKRYDPHEAEPRWQKMWEDEGIYEIVPDEDSYTIDTPPPTVSGRMHIGHTSSYAQEDFYARFWRMKTGNVFYPFGTDDNGLPTERLVEKTKKVSSTKMSRKEFRELCHFTIKELLPEFVEDWKRIGMSCDFKTVYSTIDSNSQKISQHSFIDLYKKGLVHRKETPVAWCMTCQTAIAQAEFENKDLTSTFNDVIFKAGDEELIISTTRPEFIPACVALAAHPDDERYTHLKGKRITIPLYDYKVPVIFDKEVAIDKGTGLMMICTFGDKDDVEKWHRYNLDLRIIFTKDGKLNELAGDLEGLSIIDARKKILDTLKEKGHLVKQQPITHPVNVHERCGTGIEFLKSTQWFVKVLENKNKLLAAGKKINWHPAYMQVRYEHWVENLNWDWCISRQRYFGVPFPVWYDKRTGEPVIADESQLPVDPFVDKPKSVPESDWKHLVPEEDVMDTWATSSVTPQIALAMHGKQDLIPMSLRPQAHDIIRTWAFYTIVKSLFSKETIPWKDIAISGFVTDPKGHKMSKSKGNVVSPQDVMDKFSADSIRFWAAGAKLGDDIPYMEKDLVTGNKTLTKLWNASKFVIMNLDDYKGFNAKFEDLELMDRWILSKFNRLVKSSTDAFSAYDHSKVKFDVEQFFWNDFCDNYLEIVKGRLYDPKDTIEKTSAQYALSQVIEGILKLFAPIMPFITEEIYAMLPFENKTKSIHISSWPDFRKEWVDSEAELVGEDIVKAVQEVRKYKSANQLSMNAPVSMLRVLSEQDLTLAENDLIAVTKAESFDHELGEFKVDIE
ncbi:valine--tRNA ligase [Candidatus Woesearchaeota archaeon]|nr:valine--tRNA ligase [Candidatus Woesearchaeota archaeon]